MVTIIIEPTFRIGLITLSITVIECPQRTDSIYVVIIPCQRVFRRHVSYKYQHVFHRWADSCYRVLSFLFLTPTGLPANVDMIRQGDEMQGRP